MDTKALSGMKTKDTMKIIACSWKDPYMELSEYKKRLTSNKKNLDIPNNATIEVKVLKIPNILDPKLKIIENLIHQKNDEIIMSKVLQVAVQYNKKTYGDLNIGISNFIYLTLLFVFSFYVLYKTGDYS